MKLWKTYDFDESGDLDPSEACGLIREMLHNSASNPGMPKLKCQNNLLIIPGSLDFWLGSGVLLFSGTELGQL